MKTIISIFLYLFSTVLYADGQTVITNYDDARDNYFWDKLYVNTGESLYCGLSIPFPDTEETTIEHVYSADWIADFHGCTNRDNCDAEQYKRAEADLHNLWPEIGRINSSRGKTPFNEIEPDKRRFTDLCPDYERSSKSGDIPAYVEPRDSVKGNIARSLFYMHTEYGLPLKGMLPMLKRWNRSDPPGEHEHWRNERIFEIQGTRNKFIDNYFLGNSL